MSIFKKIFKHRAIRYIFVGGINTAVSYGIYTLLIFLNLHYIAAQVINFIVSNVFNFFMHKRFTFQTVSRSKTEFIKFLGINSILLPVNLAILWLMVDVGGFNEYLAGLMSLTAMIALGFVGHNFLTFNEKQKNNIRK